MKIKKIPKIILVTIILSIFMITFLIISIVTSVELVKRCENSISNIGVVELNQETEEKIDKALGYYNKLDTNISLDKKVSNKEELDNSINEYVRLALKKAIVADNRKIADNISEEEISQLVNNANGILKKYIKEENYNNISGYSEFKPLVDKYVKEEINNSNKNTSNSESAEEPEIC